MKLNRKERGILIDCLKASVAADKNLLDAKISKDSKTQLPSSMADKQALIEKLSAAITPREN